MKALVLGASGHIGNAVVRALLDRNDEVTACSRATVPPPNLTGLAVNYSPGDADQPGQLNRWIAGHDLVVDAAAPYPIGFTSVLGPLGKDPIADADRRTRWLLDAVAKHNARLAYVSSFVTLVRPRTHAQQLQAQMIRFTHPYLDVKELIEAQILDAQRRGLHAVIVNPTYCIGPWDLRDRRLCPIPLLLSGEIPASSSQMLKVIDVRDVAAALLAALDAERYGEPLLLSAYDISAHQFYSMICELGGAPPPRFSAPSALALTGLYLVESLLGAFGRQTPLPSGGMITATAFGYLDRASALPELGVTPRPLSGTVGDAIGWYRAIGYC
jgi:dihydroflavonol-4-reductase